MSTRHIYASVTVRPNKKGELKKKASFGEEWGTLTRREGNTKCLLTGEVSDTTVIDFDENDLKLMDPKLRRLLGDPTVKTGGGWHWYFNYVREINQTQGLFPGVDVRNDGGLVFMKYWGDEPTVSYEMVGKKQKMSKRLIKYLIEAQKPQAAERHEDSVRLVAIGEPWPKQTEGEEHERLRSLVDESFKAGMTYDQVKAKHLEYLDNHLDHSAHEVGLMDGRLTWSAELFEKGAQLDGEVLEGNISPVKVQLAEENAPIIWEPELGVFVEIKPNRIIYHKKNNFTQTLRSRYAWSSKDANEHLSTYPEKRLVYKPSECTKEDEVNAYRGVDPFVAGEYDKIMMIIDNLFIDQDGARDRFINWMAYVIQTKERSGVAWGFFGAAGSGKGFVADLMSKMVGRHNSSMGISDSELQDTFNEYALHRVFIHLNEVASDFHGRHGVAGKLKQLVADSVLNINQKNMPKFQVDNHANVILNSNKHNPIEIDKDDRRWNMIVSKQSLTVCQWWTPTFYDEAMDQFSAFGDMLMNYECDKAAATSPMEITKEKQGIIEATTSPLDLGADYINKQDAEGLIGYLGLEEDNIWYSEVEWAAENGKWSNELLIFVVTTILGERENVGVFKVRKIFMVPYLKGASGSLFKNKNNKAVKGVLYI